jgi:hypothetical protein
VVIIMLNLKNAHCYRYDCDYDMSKSKIIVPLN